MRKKISLFVLIFICFLCNIYCVNAYDKYEVGDEVTYKNELYFVFKPSDENTNYVTLLKGNSLTVEEIYKYGKNPDGSLFVNKNITNRDNPEDIVPTSFNNEGDVSYYNSPTCTTFYYWNVSSFSERDTVISGCKNDYESSDVKKVVDNWVKDKFNDSDLVEVDGYKSRLWKTEEIRQLPWYVEECGDYCYYTLKYDLMPKRMAKSIQHSWSMDAAEGYIINYGDVQNAHVYMMPVEYGVPFYHVVYKYGSISPVINLKKDAINNNNENSNINNDNSNNDDNKDNNNNVENNKSDVSKYKYKANELVTYKGENYYVLYNSNEMNDYVTLVKEKPLLKEEISRYYYEGYDSIKDTKELNDTKDHYGMVAITSGNSYANSNLKDIVDSWATDTFGDSLKEARLLTLDDLIDHLHYDADMPISAYNYVSGSSTPDWVINDINYNFWTMTQYEDSNTFWVVSNKKYSVNGSEAFGYPNEEKFSTIRPVITIHKCSINDDNEKCLECLKNKVTYKYKKKNSFKRGDEVTFHDEKFYVSRTSDESMSYVVLIRKTPFTADELNRYGVNLAGISVLNNYVYVNDTIDDEKNTELYKDRYYKSSDFVSNEYERSIPYGDYLIRYYVVQTGNAYSYADGIGGMQWYSGTRCGYNDEILTGNSCKSGYETSNVKIVIDNWVKDKFNENELIDINGYKSRVVNLDDLSLDNVKYSNYDFWLNTGVYRNNLMLSYYGHDVSELDTAGYFDETVLYTGYNGKANHTGYYDHNDLLWYYDKIKRYRYIYPAVWPVIIVNKCAIDGGCEIKEIENGVSACFEVEDIEEPDDPLIEPEKPNKEKDPEKNSENEPEQEITIVDVENTIKTISILTIIIGIIIACVGLIVYNKSKKSVKK